LLNLHLAVAFVKAEYVGLAEGATSVPAMHAARAEVGFIYFNISAHRLDLIAVPSHAPVQRGQMAVDGNTAETGHCGNLHGVQVEHEQTRSEIFPLGFENGKYTALTFVINKLRIFYLD